MTESCSNLNEMPIKLRARVRAHERNHSIFYRLLYSIACVVVLLRHRASGIGHRQSAIGNRLAASAALHKCGPDTRRTHTDAFSLSVPTLFNPSGNSRHCVRGHSADGPDTRSNECAHLRAVAYRHRCSGVPPPLLYALSLRALTRACSTAQAVPSTREENAHTASSATSRRTKDQVP